MENKNSLYISDRDRIERALQIFLDLEETFKPILDNINELLDLPNLISQFDPDTVALLKDIAENLEEIIKVSTVEFGVDDGYLSWRFATDPDWTPIISMDELKGDVGAGLELEGSVEEYADLPNDLGIEDAGKAYLVEDNGLLYIWDGTSFPSEANGISFVGPPGTSLFSELEDDPKDNTLLRDYLDEKMDDPNVKSMYDYPYVFDQFITPTGYHNPISQPQVILLALNEGKENDTRIRASLTMYGLTAVYSMQKIETEYVVNHNDGKLSGGLTYTTGNLNSHVQTKLIECSYDGRDYYGFLIDAGSSNYSVHRWYVTGMLRQASAQPFKLPRAVLLSEVDNVEDSEWSIPTSSLTGATQEHFRERTIYHGNVIAEEFTADGHRLTKKTDKIQTYENRSSDYTITDAETHDVDRITGPNDVVVTLDTNPESGFWRVIRQRDEGRAILNPTSGTQIRGATETTGPDSSLLLMRVGQMTWEVYGG